jgi:carbamoyl-phosphate synthase small subunit
MAGDPAYLLLEDGRRFDGVHCGAPGSAVGEVVFTTGMSGYQESMSDPSFAGQMITFTYPHIGNYGASHGAMESARAWGAAAIMREAHNGTESPEAQQGWLDWLAAEGVPAISDVDTRSLVRHIRSAGAMRGGLFAGDVPQGDAADMIAAEPPMDGRDLAALVTPTEVLRAGDADRPLVAVLDTGVKRSMIDNLLARGHRVELHPCSSSAQQLLAGDPEAILLANGPGDPAALDHVVDTVRELLGKRPIWGICLGHQLLCRAVGLETFKLPFGHRGANHPVKDLATGRIEITSQNHGFAVVGPGGRRRLDADEPVQWETQAGDARLSHVNLYDRTVEGLQLLDVPAASVQYHPEAGPGPHDSLYLFDRFLQSAAGDAQRRAQTQTAGGTSGAVAPGGWTA